MPKTQWPSAGSAKYLLTVGALAVSYFAAAEAGLAFAIPPGNATAVWPASGIALAAVLLLGFRVWPGIWLGAIVANLTTGVSLLTAIAIGGGNTLATILGAWLFCRFLSIDAPFAKVRDAFIFAAVAAVACMVAASIGASSLLIGGYLRWPQFAANLSTWWLGDVAGQIIVVPLVLACVGRRWRVRTKPQWAELALYLIVLVVVGQCIFGGWFPERLAENVLYVPMILLIWASLRFGLVEVALGTALLSIAAIWGTCIYRVGAYGTEAVQESLFDLQIFMNTYAVTGLALAGLAAGRRAAEQALIESTASFEAVFNSAPVMMILLDEHRNVRAANPAAAAVLTAANRALTDQRYGHAVQCVHTLNEPLGCGGKGVCGSCGVRRIIDRTFETSAAFRAEEVCLTRSVDGMSRECYFLMSTSLPQIPGKGEVLVCLEDITSRKQAEQALREKEAELIAAAEIQNFLLPQEPVSVPGFSIAGRCYPTEVAAGDYFDYLWLPDGSFLIVLGDVTGHGLGPAIVTAAAHARFRALAENHSDLTQIALKANAALHRKTRDDMFLTLIAGRIDLKSRELTYFNAGHPPAQVLDSAGDVKATLEPTSMPLGILPDIELDAGARVPLADHDIVLFHTDGLVEAQPARGSPFGIDRALQVVRDNSGRCAAEIIEALRAAVCQHTGTERLRDDLTLVVVKVDQTS